MGFLLTCSNWSFDADLQIVHADVKLEIDGETLIDEPLCIDVGLPALLLSVHEDVEPFRWAPADEWQRIPFFCCGCGDPECRAFSFIVRHKADRWLELTEVEEREGRSPRELGTYDIDWSDYAKQVREIGETFLRFVEHLDYRPYFKDTVETVKRQLARG
ncbi:hypothetical protein [Paenibacillus elgii]|uniref:hypothetical protein n=1 Tax=Paenibacillus elgii TaxID=189691 RepID=UPI0013CFB6EA|nr:hypothetical protein [Paenibacillus elgii]